MTEDDLPTLIARQLRKLWLIGGMLALAGIGIIFPGDIALIIGATVIAVRIGTLGLIFSALAIAFFTILCPYCGLRLVLYAMSNRSAGEWLQWLLKIKKCPRCGRSNEIINTPSS